MVLSLLLLLLVSICKASHFFGTMMTYYPSYTDINQSVQVVLRSKMNFRLCTQSNTWICSSLNCGAEISLQNTVIDSESSGEWCQREEISTRQVPSNASFQMVLRDGAWVRNQNGIINWQASTVVEVRNRSDTNKANSSPQTTVLPLLRVPSNCQRDFNFLAFDADGDDVRCRYGKASLSECSTCTQPSVLSLSSSCTLSFSPTKSSNEGVYVVQMVMEDFPQQNITLTQTNGSQEVKTNNDAISKIPVQFVVSVDPAAQSCTEGLYLPRFLSPTPANGARLYTFVNQPVIITITAEALNATKSELLYSGPSNINQTTSVPGQYILTWTPSQSEDRESHPICFVVQATYNGVKYHSELRCVVVSVKAPSPPPIRHKVVVALKMKVSSPSPVSEEDIRISIIQQVNIRVTQYYELCAYITWQCLTGDCGGEYTVGYTVGDNVIEDWCQMEGVSTRQVFSNAPFQMWLNGSNWTSNANGIVHSKAVTLVELRTRSDIGKANTSPQTTILADLRVPSNCERVYSLLAFDPDGDDVKCRPGNASLSECDTCTLPSGFFLDNCTFSMVNVSIIEASVKYVIQLVMEDFPRQTITLTQSDGSQTTLTTSDAISKIPVQFVFQVDPPAPSCTEGLYIPQFLPPTPAHGAQLFANYVQIDITVQANASTISDLVVSGPHNVILTSSGPGQFTLTWSPTQNEAGESHSICFVAEAFINSVVYQSVLRCVIVIVPNDLTPAPPSVSSSPTYVVNNTESITTPPDMVNTSSITDSPSPLVDGTTPSPNPTDASTPPPTGITLSAAYIVGLSVRVSSLTPLSEVDFSSAIQQVKTILMSVGLSQDITISIVNAVQL